MSVWNNKSKKCVCVCVCVHGMNEWMEANGTERGKNRKKWARKCKAREENLNKHEREQKLVKMKWRKNEQQRNS
jgi:hypothetical protein